MCFFFNDTAPTEIYTLSLHDALPILLPLPTISNAMAFRRRHPSSFDIGSSAARPPRFRCRTSSGGVAGTRSEEHTSELQSRQYIVCRLLLGTHNLVRSSADPSSDMHN